MKPEIRRIFISMVIPLFILFILYMIKIMEVGMDWNFTRLGIYPLTQKGFFGVFAHPLVHTSFRHLFANTLPLFFLSWCLFYFYRDLGALILFFIWIVGGLFTFVIGKPGWHVGASGLIYGIAFFLFFSGILRKHIPLIAISLLVTFLYGGLVWNMLPFFAKPTTSWEGHLGGGIAGIMAAFLFKKKGPQRPDPVEGEEEEEGEEDELPEERKGIPEENHEMPENSDITDDIEKEERDNYPI